MIQDMHCHIAGIGAGGSGCAVSERLRKNWRFSVYMKTFGATPAEVEAVGDELIGDRLSRRLGQSREVASAVILAMDARVDGAGRPDPGGSEFHVPNDHVIRLCRRHANLRFGASVHPLRRDALDELDRVKENGAALCKWLPAIQGMDPADESLIPFYEKLKTLRLPLLTHAGDEHSFSRADQNLGDPRRLELPLSMGVVVIAAHVASTGRSGEMDAMERLLTMFPRHPTLYGDISSLTQINKRRYVLRLLRRPEIFDRLLYGSDMPLIATPLVWPGWYMDRLGPLQALRTARIRNPWDKDLALKRALGFPEHILLRRVGTLYENHP